jgi:transposase
MIETFKYRLKPTPVQQELLNKHFGCVRKVYNMALDYKKKSYQAGEKISCYEIKKLLPAWKKELVYLKEVNSLSKFITYLDYKLKRRGKKLIKIDSFFPSSKICSNCSHLSNELALADRTWICPNCNVNHDRDINAAINIRNEGIRILSTVGTTGC